MFIVVDNKSSRHACMEIFMYISSNYKSSHASVGTSNKHVYTMKTS